MSRSESVASKNSSSKLVFSDLLTKKSSLNIRLANTSSSRIVWAVKMSNTKRLTVHPQFGVLDVEEAVVMTISCDPSELDEEAEDKICVEWTNTPPGTKKEFRREWLQGEAMVHKKNFPIEYDF